MHLSDYSTLPASMAIFKKKPPKLPKHFLLHIFLMSSLLQRCRTPSSEFQVFCNVLLVTMETIFHSTVACYYIFCYAYRLASEGLSLYPFSSKFHLFSS